MYVFMHRLENDHHDDYHTSTSVSVCFSAVRTLRSPLLASFQVHHAVLLTTATPLYIRPAEFIHLITGTLYHLTNIYPLPPPPALGSNLIALFL